MTLAQKEQERSPLIEMQDLYFTSFHDKVSSSNIMYEFYSRAVLASGAIDLIKKSDKPITIVDVAGGRGVVGDVLRKLLEERGISKSFNYVVVDISQGELGREGWKDRIVGNMAQFPLADKEADVVFLLNLLDPHSVIESHMQKKTLGEEDSRVYSLIDNIGKATFMLNLCEVIRVLKENGVFVEGGKYRGFDRTDFKGLIPVESDKFEVFRLDEGVKKLWSDYGAGIRRPEFFIETLIKRGEVDRKWIDEYEGILKYNLEELSKSSRFWEITEEMRAEKAKDGVKTKAGIVKIVREKHPIEDSIRRQYGEGEDRWQVILKPSGSSKEEEIGDVFVFYRKVGNIKDMDK